MGLVHSLRPSVGPSYTPSLRLPQEVRRSRPVCVSTTSGPDTKRKGVSGCGHDDCSTVQTSKNKTPLAPQYHYFSGHSNTSRGVDVRQVRRRRCHFCSSYRRRIPLPLHPTPHICRVGRGSPLIPILKENPLLSLTGRLGGSTFKPDPVENLCLSREDRCPGVTKGTPPHRSVKGLQRLRTRPTPPHTDQDCRQGVGRNTGPLPLDGRVGRRDLDVPRPRREPAESVSGSRRRIDEKCG